VFIIALVQGKINIVQASILGSILSNILLVLPLLTSLIPDSRNVFLYRRIKEI
jgi:Ca2+/H+ antiporter